jgi:hypothetical protein
MQRSGWQRLGAAVASAVAVLGLVLGLSASPAQATTYFNKITAQHSGKVMSATPQFGGTVREGNIVVQATFNSLEQRQQWEVISHGSDGNGGAVFSYRLRAKITAKDGSVVPGCLDLPNDSSVQPNNTAVVVRPCDGSFSQRWIRNFSADPTSGTVKTVSQWSGAQWAVHNASQQEGAALILFNSDGGANHIFSVIGVTSIP